MVAKSPEDRLKTFLDLAAQGLSLVPLVGKSPSIGGNDWKSKASSEPAQIEKWFSQYNHCNMGCVTTEDIWILDVDDANWFMDHCKVGFKTLTVRSGSGGYHFYFKGQKPFGLATVKNPAFDSSKEAGQGNKRNLIEYPSMCVAPGSIHPDTGLLYTIIGDSPVVPLPKELHEFLASLVVLKPTDPRLKRRPLRAGWNPAVELEKAGLKFSQKVSLSGLVYFNYHTEMGRCLVKKALHKSHATNRDQSAFVWNPKNGHFWHECFSPACQVPGSYKIALEELGIEPNGIKRKLNAPALVVSSSVELQSRTFKTREPLMVTKNGHAVFHQGSLNEIHAWRGTGKTGFGISLANALANGAEFLAWKAAGKFRVLYIEGELPGTELQERFKALVTQTENLLVVTPEEQGNCSIPRVSTKEGRDLIEEAIVNHKIEVLFLDSISSLANISTNDEESWLEISEWFQHVRNKYGLGLFYMHHDGKGGSQRGHSKHEDLLDKAVHLYWPDPDNPPVDRLQCILKFDKARQPVKEDSHLDIELIALDNGNPQWCWSDAKKKKAIDVKPHKHLAEINKRLAEGQSKQEIADRLGITIRTIDRILAEAATAEAAKAAAKSRTEEFNFGGNDNVF